MSAPEPQGLSEAMRPIRKYLAQAKQLDQINPSIAYLCRVHAVQVGLKIKDTPADLEFLMSVMDWLEANSQCIAHIPQDQRGGVVDDFSAQLFEVADATDRSTGSTQDTCRTFLAVAILLDVCEQFGPLSEDQIKVRRYSTWKAADISRSLKQGIKPTAGGPPEIDPFFDAEVAAAASLPTPQQQQQYQQPPQQQQQPQAPQQQQYQQQPQHQYQQPQQQQPPQQQQQQQQQAPQQQHYQPAPTPQPTPVSAAPSPASAITHPVVPVTATTVGDSLVVKGNLLPRDQAFTQVDRLCKHAISAVAFDDVKTATDKLIQALSLLIPYQPK
jgi:vacuolar protein sorting-associated protein VTA1